MPWITPPLAEIRRLNRDYVAARLLGADEILPVGPARVLADANAAGAHASLQHQEWIARQILPDTADADVLDRFGTIWVGGRKAATFASGFVAVTGTEGLVLPIGTTFSYAGGGGQFQTTADVMIGPGATAAPIIAVQGGAAGNLVAGVPLQMSVAIAGIQGTATVTSLSGGIDTESDVSLRDRVITRIQKPPQGGAMHDYVAWARAVPGVTRAWAAQEAGLGTVSVRFMMDDDRTDGIPGPDDIARVATYIGPRRPVTAQVFVMAPTTQPISFRIGDLSRMTDSTVEAIRQSALAMFRQRAVPGGTTYRSWVDEAISRASGEDHHELTFQTTAAISPGHLPILGSISYGG